MVLFQTGRSAAGQDMIRSHTGALAGDARGPGGVPAPMRHRAGRDLRQFVETVELFADRAARRRRSDDEVIVVSGSGGGAAVAADVLRSRRGAGAARSAATKERIDAILPEFGSVTNPDRWHRRDLRRPGAAARRLFDAMFARSRPLRHGRERQRAPGRREACGVWRARSPDAARASGRTVVAYQSSPLGGPLDPEVVKTLHSADMPFLLGTSECDAGAEISPAPPRVLGARCA